MTGAGCVRDGCGLPAGQVVQTFGLVVELLPYIGAAGWELHRDHPFLVP